MILCQIIVDGFYVGKEYFSPEEITGLNNEPGIRVSIIKEGGAND